MKIVTAGDSFIDIDAYACMFAYAELLNKIGHDAQAVSTAPFNESISKTVRSWKAEIKRTYSTNAEDRFILVDISDPGHFDVFVKNDDNMIVEVIDHHPGFELHWADRIGKKAEIREIGAAATQIYERFKLFNEIPSMVTARLLATAILDNTLNFISPVTKPADIAAYESLITLAHLPVSWPAQYFSECQQAIMSNLARAAQLDTKLIRLGGLSEHARVGQIIVWDTRLIRPRAAEIYAALGFDLDTKGFINLVDISLNKTYFLTQNQETKSWLSNNFSTVFHKDEAQADRAYLRKEILRINQNI